MSYRSPLLSLIPKSFHFDAYNIVNFANTADRPFFSDYAYNIGNYQLKTTVITVIGDSHKLKLAFSSVCADFLIHFVPVYVTLEQFAQKILNAVKSDSDYITFEIPINYIVNLKNNLSCSRSCRYWNNDCGALSAKCPEKSIAAVSFDPHEMRKAVNQHFNLNMGGTTTMKKNNNFLGMNFELGASKDPNIASTMMGVAVRNPVNSNWYTFDITTNTRKNLANFKMGNFPILLLPTRTLAVGDLIKYDGKYHYVKSVNAQRTITLIGAVDGVVREVIPEESIIGNMTFYTKVIAMDPKSLMDPTSNKGMGGNLLAAILMMQWSNNNGSEFSLDNITDESFNGLGAYWPLLMSMNGTSGLSNMFDEKTLTMLMMMDNNNSANSMMQNLVLMQCLGGTNESPINDIINSVIPSESTAEQVICEDCNATYPAGTNFCSKCGKPTKPLAATCPKCNVVLLPGAVFCHRCGTNVTSRACPNCGRTAKNDELFCSKCGTRIEAKPVKHVCANCGRTLDENEAFCSKCGTKTNGSQTTNVVTTKPARKRRPTKPATESAAPAPASETDTKET